MYAMAVPPKEPGGRRALGLLCHSLLGPKTPKGRDHRCDRSSVLNAAWRLQHFLQLKALPDPSLSLLQAPWSAGKVQS